MKLAFSTLACPNWSFPEVVGAAAAHGFAGVELRGLGPEIDITRLPRFNEELADTLALLREHGLKIPCLNTSIALVTPPPDRWQMMLDECHRYATLAGRIAAPYLRIFGGLVPRGMTDAEAHAMARRHLRQLLKICGPHRCMVLLETHDEWAASGNLLSLLEGFSPEEVGVLWDVEPPCRRGESPADTAQTIRPYLRHVQLRDSLQREGKTLPRLLGEGDLPLGDIVRALRAIGYDQWISLATEKRWHAEDAPEPEQSLPQFVDYMKKLGISAR